MQIHRALQSGQGQQLREAVRIWIDSTVAPGLGSRDVSSPFRRASALRVEDNVGERRDGTHDVRGTIRIATQVYRAARDGMARLVGEGPWEAEETYSNDGSSVSEAAHSGEMLRREVRALNIVFHEELHGYSSAFGSYVGPGEVLEDVLVELYARQSTEKLLESPGLFGRFEHLGENHRAEISALRVIVRSVLGDSIEADERIRRAGHYAWQSTIWSAGHYVRRFVDGLDPNTVAQRDELRARIKALRAAR